MAANRDIKWLSWAPDSTTLIFYGDPMGGDINALYGVEAVGLTSTPSEIVPTALMAANLDVRGRSCSTPRGGCTSEATSKRA